MGSLANCYPVVPDTAATLMGADRGAARTAPRRYLCAPHFIMFVCVVSVMSTQGRSRCIVW